MNNYQAFTNKWNGLQVTRFGAECVGGIAEYESENGLPIVWGDAHTWINNPTMLSAYDWIDNNPNDPNQLPSQGDIIIWPLPNEHIAFFDHNIGNHQFMSFGQNSGGPTMHFQPHSWANVAGWYTPKYVAAPAPTVNYTITPITPLPLHVKANRNKWNLAQPDFNAVVANPITTSGDGYDFTVVATLTRPDDGFANYTYYLDDANTPHGWNSLDCEEPSMQPMPVPYTPPAAPVPVKLADKITLVTMVPTYSNELDAANRNEAKAIGSFRPGEYYQFAVNDTGLLRIGLTNQATTTVWINPKDNVAPEIVPVTVVKPEPTKESELIVTKPSEVLIGKANDTTWKQSYHSYHADRSPETYELLEDYTMLDYGGSRPPINLTKGRHINVPGEFNKNGVKFYRPRDYHNDVTYQWFYGVPLFDDDGNPMMRKIVDTPPQRLSDLWHVWREDIKNYLGNKSIWDVIKKKRSK